MTNGLLSYFAATCAGNKIFGIPTWYQYLSCHTNAANQCTNPCLPVITNIGDVWLIVAAIINILLRIAALAAVVFVIYSGVLYATSQGSPEQTAQAKNTLINALVGLAIAVTAAVAVGFIAGSFNAS